MWMKHADELSIANWLAEPQEMSPIAAARAWPIPRITSIGALAQWLKLPVTEVEWFADNKSLLAKTAEQKLQHYVYRILPKPMGNLRLIEAPKGRLKGFQRRILKEILAQVPPHPAAHGFLNGRSVKTFVTPHVGRRVVLRMDLQDFFPSISRARVQAVFRTLGYPEPVADLLGGICTNNAPQKIWSNSAFCFDANTIWAARCVYSQSHLPQGAPTSPALSNLCFYRADCRLAGLARSAGAVYTRYADDLAFSGDWAFEKRADRFAAHVAAILMEEGFAIHYRKTRLMRRGVRQHLAGVVVNDRTNVMRPDFDRLKAVLTNCVRKGPTGQNREAHPHFRSHLEGRVQFVEAVNPQKGKRLRTIFDEIQWE